MSSVKLRHKPSSKSAVGVSAFVIICTAKIKVKDVWINNDVQDKMVLLSLLLTMTLVSMFFLFVEPINQQQKYHDFADKRLFLCACHSDGLFLPPNSEIRRNRKAGFVIPNFGDVMSNFVILIGGLSGTILLRLKDVGEVDEIRLWQLKVCLPIFFYSTIAISLGSTYYHWNPSNQTLVWDRLPMTVAFVSIFCYILEDYLEPGIGSSLLSPLIFIGVMSVLYWNWTDDLRLYALVQFLPLGVMTVLVMFCQSRYGGVMQHALALMLYALAKMCEDRDYEIWRTTKKTISGHSLKHILAGMASVMISTLLFGNEENNL
mmetsp:Transcript_3706/g.5650  ORF Transcript_3706/g.5650 Transcript_3706/m.5650 type:complete len:318 (-) Transcript_3706:2338-3291(-)